MSASAVPSAGTPPSSALSRLIGLPNNQTPSESSKMSVGPFEFGSHFAPFGV